MTCISTCSVCPPGGLVEFPGKLFPRQDVFFYLFTSESPTHIMQRHRRRLFTGIVLILGGTLAAQPRVPLQLGAPVGGQNESRFREGKENWQEDVSQRTANSSSYRTGDGRLILHYSSRPLNYKDATGAWQRVELQPVYAAGKWSAVSQPGPVYVFSDGSCALAGENGAMCTFSSAVRINGRAVSESRGEQDGNTVLFRNIAPGIDKVCEFRYGAVKYNYNLMQPYTAAGDLLIDEMTEFPEGALISQSANENNGKDELLIKNTRGKALFRFHTPVCFDAAGQAVAGAYELTRNGIRIRVPGSWLRDPARAYPVVVDPLVTGPTSTWTGGSMPSCMLPSYNVDSIQVTKPAQVTLTGFFVTGSYYADPFTPAQMHNGRMSFSTSCSQGPVLTITGPNGNSPGTAYLQDFDYRPQLTCCWPNSCSAQQFWLRMHVARDSFSTGCNTTYIRYDPVTTSWPFEAYMEGHTVESAGLGWNVAGSPVCSDDCSINGTVYIRYGVPPYTITHPWMQGSTTVGTTLTPCFTGSTNSQLSLTVPNCPQYCSTNNQLVIPPPQVYDACNQPVFTYVNDTIGVTPVPLITSTPPASQICTGQQQPVSLSTCTASGPINWTGSNGASGTGSLLVADTNSGTTPLVITYVASSSYNGCAVPNDTFTVTVLPQPYAGFTFSSPVFAGQPATFSNASSYYAGTSGGFGWTFSDGGTAADSVVQHTFSAPGTYTVCLAVVTSNGCSDSICRTIEVIPAEIVTPNVFTPNGDGVNDMLTFKYLEFFPENHLKVFNRWGNLIFEKDNYQNDWSAPGISDGTYYYLLEVPEKKYSSILTIIR